MVGLGSRALLLAFGLAFASLLAPLRAEAAEPTLISALTVDEAKSILLEWGATEVTPQASEFFKVNEQVTIEMKVLLIKRDNITFRGDLYCHPQAGCLGFQMTCAFENEATTADTLNTFNANYRAGKAYRAPRVIVSERYMILDNGVSRANILTQLNIYLAMTGAMLEHAKKGDIVAAAPGGGAQLSFSAPSAAVAFHAAASARASKPDVINRAR